ncbi:MAG: hypothetical protein IKM95_06030 [Bacteroidales bacterium]|nr:hypothetical protein [Bacteroidales bacterium]
MKRFLRLSAVMLMLVLASSCTKTKYCQCFAYINNEDIALGEDYYIVENGTCNDKAKEIVGWGAVTCKEVNVESEDDSWYSKILNFFKPNNNNNNNNHNNSN